VSKVVLLDSDYTAKDVTGTQGYPQQCYSVAKVRQQQEEAKRNKRRTIRKYWLDWKSDFEELLPKAEASTKIVNY